MVPFYGTVYKSILYDLIIPFPACESGAEREKRRAVVFCVREDPQKANNLIINSLWIVFYAEWNQLPLSTNVNKNSGACKTVQSVIYTIKSILQGVF